MNKTEYFSKAESWAIDQQTSASRSQKLAWTVAGAAVGLAMLEAVALALLTPLKTVQPVTLLVDRQTGYVEALDPKRPKRITADEALLQALLAQYVSAREGFDRATIASDYRKVALWSGGNARRDYLAAMPASNPASPFQRYPAGTVVVATVTSVSPVNKQAALVRFKTQRQDLRSGTTLEEPWISLVRYKFVDGPMKFEDRLINPLGLQVTGYRRDPEAPQPSVIAAQATTGTTEAIVGVNPGNAISGGRTIISSQISSGSPLVSSATSNGSGQSR